MRLNIWTAAQQCVASIISVFGKFINIFADLLFYWSIIDFSKASFRKFLIEGVTVFFQHAFSCHQSLYCRLLEEFEVKLLSFYMFSICVFFDMVPKVAVQVLRRVLCINHI